MLTSTINIAKEIEAYNSSLAEGDNEMCTILSYEITKALPEAENKIWHRHPVWFLDGNPVAGYSKLKDCIRLMFWSGADFEEDKLQAGTGKFKDVSIRYNSVDDINKKDLKRWLKKSRDIQWDYKNIMKRKGKLVRLK